MKMVYKGVSDCVSPSEQHSDILVTLLCHHYNTAADTLTMRHFSVLKNAAVVSTEEAPA